MDDAGVAVVGMAGLFPGAKNADAYWQNIVSGRDCVGPYDPGRLDPIYFSDALGAERFYCDRGGFLDASPTIDATRYGIMPSSIDEIEPDQLIALKLADDAIEDAGGRPVLGDPGRVGVLLGHGGYVNDGIARLDMRTRVREQLAACLRLSVPGITDEELAEFRTRFAAQCGPPALVDVVPNLVASRIANRLDFGGPAFAVDGACASSLLAVESAVRELRSGRCDAVLAGGVHHSHDVTFWSVFTHLGAMSESATIRPFDRRADGLVIGEGSGVVVLKRLVDAQRDDDRIYAVIRGVGSSSDGRTGSAMRPDAAGQMQALSRAWADADLSPDRLGLLEAHGTGTPVGDQVELATVADFFGPPTGARATIGSVKSMIGHTMPAAGIAGLIKAVLALHHQELPPTLNCEEPHTRLAESRFMTRSEVAPWDSNGQPRVAAVNAFGFGGIDAHVVCEEAPTKQSSPSHRARPAVPRGRRDVLMLEGSAAEVVTMLRDGTPQPAAPGAASGDTGQVRLVVLDPTEERIAKALKIAERGRLWRERSGIWFVPDGVLRDGVDGESPRVAFVFPGVEPIFGAQTDDLAALYGGWSPPAPTGSVENWGRAVFAASRVVDDSLRSIGIQPDDIAGHSLGEWSAMLASQMLPPAEFAAFNEQLDEGFLRTPAVSLLAISTGVDAAMTLLEGETEIALTHDNCPHQTVVCGPETALAKFRERVSAAGFISQELPIHSGFHSPFFRAFVEYVRPHVERMPLQQPSQPLWSATTASHYPASPDAVRKLMLDHLVEPVRFRALIEAMYASGVRVFIQAGSGSVSGFVSDTLGDRDHVAVAANTAKRTGLDQLQRTALAVWAEGGDFDLSAARLRNPAVEIPVRLGTPLINLDGLIPTARPVPEVAPVIQVAATRAPLVSEVQPVLVEPSLAVQDPVLLEFNQMMASIGAASSDVLEAWQGQGAVTVATTTEQQVEISLDRWPELIDHSVFNQREPWSDDRDRFTIVPMTMMIGLMRDAAEKAYPGRVVQSIARVRALRWLEVVPAQAVTIRIEPLETDVCRVNIVNHAEAIVTLLPIGAHLPITPPTVEPLPDERPADITAAELYRDRWMFHGPSYAGVREIVGVGPHGIRGRVEALVGPESLLDNAGQLLGYWIMSSFRNDRYALPARIDKINYHRATPELGSMVDCRIEITKETSNEITASVQMATAAGVWLTATGWVDRRFASDDIVFPIWLRPERHTLSEQRSRGYTMARDRWPDLASRELILRRYTTEAERQDYRSLGPPRQRSRLLGLIAAKDAARTWLWNRGFGTIFPAEIGYRHDEHGQPKLETTLADLHVSVAHAGSIAVAKVSTGPVGIDIESFVDDPAAIRKVALSNDEQRRFAHADRAELTRIWTAKEAVGKATGRGLQGRPRDFEIMDLTPDQARIGSWTVHSAIETTDEGDHVVSFTVHATDRI